MTAEQIPIYTAYLQGFAARLAGTPQPCPYDAHPAHILAWIIGSADALASPVGERDRVRSPAQLAALVDAKLDEPMPDPAV